MGYYRKKRKKSTGINDKHSKVYIGKKSYPSIAMKSFNLQTNTPAECLHYLHHHGFIWLKNIIPKDEIKKAQQHLKDMLIKKEKIDISSGKIKKINNRYVHGYTIDAFSGGIVNNIDENDDDDTEQWKQIGLHQDMKQIYQGPFIKSCLTRLFQRDYHLLSQHTWIRMMGKNAHTDIHADYSYFRQATTIMSQHLNSNKSSVVQQPGHCALCHKSMLYENDLTIIDPGQQDGSYVNNGEDHCNNCCDLDFPFYTCWIPLEDVSVDHSILSLISQSQLLKGYNQPYDKRGLTPAQFNQHYKKIFTIPKQGVEAGDMILFNIKTIHAASINKTPFFRYSLDTRIYVEKSQKEE